MRHLYYGGLTERELALVSGLLKHVKRQVQECEPPPTEVGGFQRSAGALRLQSHPPVFWGGSRLLHPIELITLWAMFTHAFKSLSYSIPQFGHLKILPFTWVTYPHPWHVFEVSFVSFLDRHLTSIPFRLALHSMYVLNA